METAKVAVDVVEAAVAEAKEDPYQVQATVDDYLFTWYQARNNQMMR